MSRYPQGKELTLSLEEKHSQSLCSSLSVGFEAKHLTLPEPQLPHLISGTNSIVCLPGLLWGANKIIYQLAFPKLQKQVQ